MGRRALNEALGALPLDAITAERVPMVTEALGGPPTVVVDAVGSTVSIAAAFSAAPLGSPVVLVGMGEARLSLDAYEVSTKERTLIGSFTYTHEEFRTTVAWVATAPAELGQLVQDRVGLQQSRDTFAQLARGDNTASKILVLPQT